jgi:hypothetical protein
MLLGDDPRAHVEGVELRAKFGGMRRRIGLLFLELPKTSLFLFESRFELSSTAVRRR